MSAIPPTTSPFAGVADFSVPLQSTRKPERNASGFPRWMVLAAVGLPLHYAGRTRLGAPLSSAG